MRRPLAPFPCRPNPTDPGDAADLSIPAGYSSRSYDAGRLPGAQVSSRNEQFFRLKKATGTGLEIKRQSSVNAVELTSTTKIVITARAVN
jgi:hypothetical protein